MNECKKLDSTLQFWQFARNTAYIGHSWTETREIKTPNTMHENKPLPPTSSLYAIFSGGGVALPI